MYSMLLQQSYLMSGYRANAFSRQTYGADRDVVEDLEEFPSVDIES